jgi:hypothetical protein
MFIVFWMNPNQVFPVLVLSRVFHLTPLFTWIKFIRDLYHVDNKPVLNTLSEW